MRRIRVQFEASNSIVYRYESWCLWSVDWLQSHIPFVCHATGEESVPGCGRKLVVRGSWRERGHVLQESRADCTGFWTG